MGKHAIPAAAALAMIFGLVPAAAQQSTSYKLSETTFNNGGNPHAGMDPGSAHYRITLDSIGQELVRAGAASPSYRVDAGFVGRYGPPGEVTGLRFPNQSTFVWDPKPWAYRYEVYRGTLATLPGTFGICFVSDVVTPNATDPSNPSVGQGSFFLVTARNRLREEGPKGFWSNGTEEANPTPCP
jgi:hypothetical protein